MIAILYPPGTFGTMLESCLRRFSAEYRTIDYLDYDERGSFHNHQRGPHIFSAIDLVNAFENNNICSMIYPGMNLTAQTGILDAQSYLPSSAKVILVNIGSINDMVHAWTLFTSKVDVLAPGNLIHNTISKVENIQKWNTSYQSLSDMQFWELREYISLQYSGIFSNSLNGKSYALSEWQTIEFVDILKDMPAIVKSILGYCGLTLIDEDELLALNQRWVKRQGQILKKSNSVLQMVNAVVTRDKNYEVGYFDIIQQSLIQYLLREHGYELKCEGLNDFPNTSDLLQDLIYSA